MTATSETTADFQALPQSDLFLNERHASLARLAASSLPKIVLISHALGGGTERHIQDLASLLAGKAEVLILKPAGGDVLSIIWAKPNESFVAYFSGAAEYPQLVEFLKYLPVSRVHLHHVDGQPRAILGLAAALCVPLDITLHDHFPITPQYFLDDGGIVPTHEIAHAWGLSNESWRVEMHLLLRSAARVICPSRYIADSIADYFPDVQTLTWPHPESSVAPVISAAPSPSPQTVKVLILGRMTPSKGLHIAAACAQDAKARKLPLKFVVIGPITAPVLVFPDVPLTNTGSYEEQNLPELVALERADAFLFPSQVPESFSYTLTVALAAGLPIVASRLGAFVERLEAAPQATMLDWNSAASVWNDALLAAVNPRTNTSIRAESNTSVHSTALRAYSAEQSASARSITHDPANYLANYLAGFGANRSMSVTVKPTALKAAFFYPPKKIQSATEYALADLYLLGVVCGQVEARRELVRRIDVSDQELVAARASADASHAALGRRDQDVDDLNLALQQRNADYGVLQRHQEELAIALEDTRATLEQERDEARAAFNEISASRFWRLTSPLRTIAHFLKSLKHRANDTQLSTRQLPHRISVATQILKEEGAIALSKRVHEKLTRRTESPTALKQIYALETAITPLTVRSVPPDVKPKFSIIIPVYAQHLLTFTCLKSIAATCADLDIEVIVIDDCSPEPAADALAVVTGVTIVRNEKNLGFLRNCNKAARLARGEYLMILNNDTIVTGRWLQEMARVFDEKENTGMVGCKLIYPDGSLQEAGGIIWRDGSGWNYGRNDRADKPEYNYLREADYCSGACLLIRRDFWHELGGFDEAYAPAYYEDGDLAFRVRAAGKRVFYQPRALVVHFEGKSSGTDLTQGVKKHQVINQETFVNRWRTVLAKHRINGLSPQLERDRYAKRRVLVLDACMLTPDQDAGSLRMFAMLKIMASMGCKVTFVADNLEYRLPYVQDIQVLGVEVLWHPFYSSITALLERTAAQYDVIMLSRATVAVKYVDLVKRVAPCAKLVFDTVDLHFLRQQRLAELDPQPSLIAAAEAMKKQELDIMAKSDITLVVSPVEQALLDTLVPQVRVNIVATIHDTTPGPKTFSERDGILFIGGFRHPPNLDAVTWYCENVLPIIRQKAPGLVTTLIGSNAPPSLQKFAAPDFVIAGFVQDVSPYYQSARLSISPLRYGAGVKGKINISMQYGVPVVATTVSVEGMFLRDGIEALVADTPEAFADAVIRGHADEVLWNALSKASLVNIDTYFSTRRAREALAGVLDMG